MATTDYIYDPERLTDDAAESILSGGADIETPPEPIPGRIDATPEEVDSEYLITGQDITKTHMPAKKPEPGTTIPKPWQEMYTAAMKATQQFDPEIETAPEELGKSIVMGVSSSMHELGNIFEYPDRFYNAIVDGIDYVTPGKIPEAWRAHTFQALANWEREGAKNMQEKFAPEGANTVMKKVFAGLGVAVPDIALASVSGGLSTAALAKYTAIPSAAAHLIGTAAYGLATGGAEKAKAFTALEVLNMPFRGFSKPAQMAAGAAIFGLYDLWTRNPQQAGYDPIEAQENTIASAIMGGIFPLFSPPARRSFAQDINAPFNMAKNWVKTQKALGVEPVAAKYAEEVFGVGDMHKAGQQAFYEAKELDAVRDLQIWVTRDTGETVTATGDALAKMVGETLRGGPSNIKMSAEEAYALGKGLVEGAEVANEVHRLEQIGLKPTKIGKKPEPGEVTELYEINGEFHPVRPEDVPLYERVKIKEELAADIEAQKLEKDKVNIAGKAKELWTIAYENTIAPEVRLERAMKALGDPELAASVMDPYHLQYAGSSRARLFIEDFYIGTDYANMSTDTRMDVNKYYSAARDVDIGKRHGRDFMLNDYYSMDESIARMDMVQKKYEAGKQDLTWPEFQAIITEIRDHARRPLDRLVDAEIFTPEQREKMEDIFWITSKTIKSIDAEIEAKRKGYAKKDISKARDIPFLDQSKGAIKNENVPLLVERHIAAIEHKIVRDRFWRAGDELQERRPDNLAFAKAKHKYVEIGFGGKETEVSEEAWRANEDFKKKLKEELKKDKKAEPELVESVNIEPADVEKLGNVGKGSLEYFSPKARAELAGVAYKAKERPVMMRIDDFLRLAEPGIDNGKAATVKGLLDAKTGFNSLPYLKFETGEAGQATIIGHEGRHRARALKELGVDTIPVILKSDRIRWSEQSDSKSMDYVKDWPVKLQAETTEASIDFPVSREEAGKFTISKYETQTKSLLAAEHKKLLKQFEKTEAKRDKLKRKVKARKIKEILENENADFMTEEAPKEPLVGKTKSKDYELSPELEMMKADNVTLRENIRRTAEEAFELKAELKGKNIKKSARPIVPEGFQAVEYTHLGERRFVLANEDFYKAFEAIGGIDQNRATRLAEAFIGIATGVPLTKAAAVTYNPLYGLKTGPRDIWYFYAADPLVKAFKNYIPLAVKRYPGNFRDVWNSGPKFRSYAERHGFTGEAAVMSAVIASSKSSNKLGTQLPETPAQTDWRKFKQAWTAMNAAAEITVRITHDDYLTQNLGLDGKKSVNHINQTLNFNRKGSLMHWMDKAFAFLNPATQAIDGLARSAKADPKGFAPKMLGYTAVKGTMIGLTYALGSAGVKAGIEQAKEAGTWLTDLRADLFVSDAMSKVPLDVKLGNTLIPIPGMISEDENGKRSQAFFKIPDDRNPFTTALNILMYYAADKMFGYDYEEEYAAAWVRNITPLDASRTFPLQAAFQAMFHNVDPMNFRAIENQFSLRRPKDQIDQDTNRLAVQLSGLWNAAPVPGEMSPKGLERAAYAFGLSNNLGTGMIGSLFAAEDLTPNRTMAKEVYDTFKPILKDVIYWSRSDANLTKLRDQAKLDYSEAELGIDLWADNMVKEVKAGRLTLDGALSSIGKNDNILPVDKDAVEKRIEQSVRGWDLYMRMVRPLKQVDKDKIPDLDKFELIGKTKSFDAKANWYRDNYPQDKRMQGIFKSIAEKYGLMGDRVQYRVKNGVGPR